MKKRLPDTPWCLGAGAGLTSSSPVEDLVAPAVIWQADVVLVCELAGGQSFERPAHAPHLPAALPRRQPHREGRACRVGLTPDARSTSVAISSGNSTRGGRVLFPDLEIDLARVWE